MRTHWEGCKVLDDPKSSPGLPFGFSDCTATSFPFDPGGKVALWLIAWIPEPPLLRSL